MWEEASWNNISVYLKNLNMYCPIKFTWIDTLFSTIQKNWSLKNQQRSMNISYLSRLRRYLSNMRKWSRWLEELVSVSKRLWTIITSATTGQAGAIRAKASGPMVFLSSTWWKYTINLIIYGHRPKIAILTPAQHW